MPLFSKSSLKLPPVLGAKAPSTDTFSSQLISRFQGTASSLTGQIGGAFNSVTSNPTGILDRVISGDFGGAVNSIFSQAGSVNGQQVAEGVVIGAFGSKSVIPSILPGGEASQWGQINPNLLANIYLLIDGVADDSAGLIKAPVSDIQIDFQLNWQSPFEGAGPESKAPALMALIQSGQIGIITQSLQAVLPDGNAQGGAVDRVISGVSGQLGDIAQKTKDFAKSLEGRTGITKLNSRQVFTGMPPVSITFTLHLRAYQDPVKEVIDPYQLLLEWALPEQLAQDGIIVNAANAAGSDQSLINALFPSKAPNFIGFRYANNRYEPMVIESVGHPLDGPIDESGYPLYRAVQVKISTLTALDRADIKNAILR